MALAAGDLNAGNLWRVQNEFVDVYSTANLMYRMQQNFRPKKKMKFD